MCQAHNGNTSDRNRGGQGFGPAVSRFEPEDRFWAPLGVARRELHVLSGVAAEAETGEAVRVLIALIVIVYFIGVGVALAPPIRANWSSATAAEFAVRIAQDLPYTLTWPAWVFRSLSNRG